MFLKIENNIIDSFAKSLSYFPEKYIKPFLLKESLVARYIISMYIDNTYNVAKYLPKNDNNKKPVYDLKDIYWSISHKDWFVFVWISDDKIWVDLEIYKERDISLLDQFTNLEYTLLWWKNWYNFYVLWTAKESIIKYNLLNLEELYEIELKEVSNNHKKINEIIFEKVLVLNYKSSINQVFFWKKDDVFYSVCSNSVIE